MVDEWDIEIDETACRRCQVIGRKSRNIQLMCDQCSNKECYECAREFREVLKNYKWIC